MRYVSHAKAAVDALTTADEGAALMPLSSAFVGAVKRDTIVDRLDGAQRVPLGVVARLQIGSVTATAVGEGDVKPVAHISSARSS